MYERMRGNDVMQLRHEDVSVRLAWGSAVSNWQSAARFWQRKAMVRHIVRSQCRMFTHEDGCTMAIACVPRVLYRADRS